MIMRNIQYVTLGLAATAIALSVGVETAKANTLVFNEQLKQHGQTLRWESPFDGQIQLMGQLNTNTYGLDTNIWVNGNLLDTLSIGTAPNSGIQSTNSTKELKSNWVLDVKKGTVLDFSLNAPNSSTNSEVTFDAEINFLHSPNSLVFLQPKGSDSFLHVGLLRNGQIYESSPEYPTGNYWDVMQNNDIAIVSDNGVHNQHTLGSFIHLSQDKNSSPIAQQDIVEIPLEGAAKMETYIKNQLDRDYTLKPSYIAFLSPYAQKGYYGTYTGVGLIERAAEEAGITLSGGKFYIGDDYRGQGLVFDPLEFINVNQIVYGQKSPWECLNVFPTSVQCQTQYGNRNMNNGIPFTTLSPAYMHYLLTNQNSQPADNWLHGLFEGLDFILTDPKGRRLGYTEDLGLLEEIPDAFYTGNLLDEPEHFYVPDRLVGEYKLEFFGLCNEGAKAVIGDNKNGTLISGCPPEPPEPPDDSESVPEPSTLIGLILLGGFFSKLKKVN